MSEQYPAFRRSMQGLIGRGGKILATELRENRREEPEDAYDGTGPSRVDAKDPTSSAGKRYVEHDAQGQPRRLVWVSQNTENKGLGAMTVSHRGQGQYRMEDYGRAITHSQVVSNLKSGKWTFHGSMKRSVLPPGT